MRRGVHILKQKRYSKVVIPKAGLNKRREKNNFRNLNKNAPRETLGQNLKWNRTLPVESSRELL